MLKKFYAMILICSFSASANWTKAVQAYEQQDYQKAEQYFSKLLVLGNAEAMFSLAAMTFNGEGQPADKAKAIALFKLAREFGHPVAAVQVGEVLKHASQDEQHRAEQILSDLRNKVKIPYSVSQHNKSDDVQPITRVEPAYPIEAAKRLQAGYVKLHFLVDAAGQVTNVTVLDAYPARIFIKAAEQGVARWQYPKGKPFFSAVELTFSLEVEGKDNLNINSLEKNLFENKLWDLAVAGSAEHQLILSRLMRFIALQSGVHLLFDPKQVLSKPELSILKSGNKVTASFSNFAGSALVAVDTRGVIIEQLEDENIKQPVLIGQQLSGVKQAGSYRLSSYSVNGRPAIDVAPAHSVSLGWSADYWLEQAARHGSLDAQQILAASDPNWEAYLLEIHDAQTQTWVGARLLLNGEEEKGKTLLQEALAQGYSKANVFLNQTN